MQEAECWDVLHQGIADKFISFLCFFWHPHPKYTVEPFHYDLTSWEYLPQQVGFISTFAAHKLFSLINFSSMYPIRYLFLPVEINIDAWDICLKYLGIRMRDQCCSETQLWILIALLPLGNCTIFDSIVQASHLFTDEHGREWHHSAVQHEYIHISFPSVVR